MVATLDVAHRSHVIGRIDFLRAGNVTGVAMQEVKAVAWYDPFPSVRRERDDLLSATSLPGTELLVMPRFSPSAEKVS